MAAWASRASGPAARSRAATGAPGPDSGRSSARASDRAAIAALAARSASERSKLACRCSQSQSPGRSRAASSGRRAPYSKPIGTSSPAPSPAASCRCRRAARSAVQASASRAARRGPKGASTVEMIGAMAASRAASSTSQDPSTSHQPRLSKTAAKPAPARAGSSGAGTPAVQARKRACGSAVVSRRQIAVGHPGRQVAAEAGDAGRGEAAQPVLPPAAQRLGHRRVLPAGAGGAALGRGLAGVGRAGLGLGLEPVGMGGMQRAAGRHAVQHDVEIKRQPGRFRL